MNNMIKVLLVLCMLLAIVLMLEWQLMTYPEELSEDFVPAQVEPNAELELVELKVNKQSVETYSNMVERPLFIQGRKPVVADDDEVKELEEVSKIDDFTLMGIYSLNKKTIALFSSKGKKSNYSKISAGEVISGWTLKEIQPDRVLLERNGSEETVLLRKPRPEVKKRAKRKNIRKPKRAARKKLNKILEKQHD